MRVVPIDTEGRVDTWSAAVAGAAWRRAVTGNPWLVSLNVGGGGGPDERVPGVIALAVPSEVLVPFDVALALRSSASRLATRASKLATYLPLHER